MHSTDAIRTYRCSRNRGLRECPHGEQRDNNEHRKTTSHNYLCQECSRIKSLRQSPKVDLPAKTAATPV